MNTSQILQPMTTERTTLLMVDDNPTDVQMARLMVEEMNVPIQFHSCPSGEDALEWLATSRADYMFLDLTMPGMSGFDILRTVRSNAAFDQMHIVVLTSSAFQAKIDKAYSLGANVVVTKPTTADEYQAILDDMTEFWTGLDASRPGQGDDAVHPEPPRE